MSKTTITIEFDPDALSGYEDSYLAFLWHLAQHNPAGIDDRTAGEVAERIGREIIRRWLRGTEPELWHHQGRHHYWSALSGLAKCEPDGRWVPKAVDDSGPRKED